MRELTNEEILGVSGGCYETECWTEVNDDGTTTFKCRVVNNCPDVPD